MKHLTKTELENLQLGDIIQAAHINNSGYKSLGNHLFLIAKSVTKSGRTKLRFQLERMNYKKAKFEITHWNLVIGSSINQKGEQRCYSDSEAGRVSTKIFIKQ